MATPTMVDDEAGVVTEYWSCPVRFIPSSIWKFLEYLHFYQKHPSAPFPKLEDVSERFMQAERLFDLEMMKNLQEA